MPREDSGTTRDPRGSCARIRHAQYLSKAVECYTECPEKRKDCGLPRQTRRSKNHPAVGPAALREVCGSIRMGNPIGVLSTRILTDSVLASHSQHRHHESQNRELVAITQAIAELRLQTSYQTSTITTTSAELSRHLLDVHTEIDRLTSSFNPPILRHALTEEIHKAVQHAIDTNTVNSFSAQGQSRRGNDDQGLDQRYPKKRTRLLYANETKTSTAFGIIRCSSSQYTLWHSPPGWSKQETEFRTTFRFVPAWWLMKCGFALSVIAELGRSSQAGWQFRLNTQNVCVSSSTLLCLTFYSFYLGTHHSLNTAGTETSTESDDYWRLVKHRYMMLTPLDGRHSM